jgi:hypothetical protein
MAAAAAGAWPVDVARFVTFCADGRGVSRGAVFVFFPPPPANACVGIALGGGRAWIGAGEDAMPNGVCVVNNIQALPPIVVSFDWLTEQRRDDEWTHCWENDCAAVRRWLNASGPLVRNAAPYRDNNDERCCTAVPT